MAAAIPSATTRAAGLEALSAFLAGPGAAYAADRNTDRGATEPTTSVLSPFLRRRLLTEEEVARAARRAFGERGAEAFVAEVFWRTYFKGHLETHPEAWARFRAPGSRGGGSASRPSPACAGPTRPRWAG